MRFVLLMFITVLNVVLPNLKVSEFALLAQILEIFLSSLLPPPVNFAPLLDVDFQNGTF